MSLFRCLTCKKMVVTGSGHDCYRSLSKDWRPWKGAMPPHRTPPRGVEPEHVIEAFTREGLTLRWKARQIIWWWDAQDDYNDVLAWRPAT